MPGPNVKPRFMQRCVADVTATGKELGAAFAICTAQSQKAGYSKPGSSKMTGKGAARERAFKNAPDMDQKNAEYERAVQAGRQQEETSMRSLIRQLEEAVKQTEFPTRNDMEAMGYDADSMKPGVPALVKKRLGYSAARVERALGEGGVFTFRDGFFYRGKRDADHLGAETVDLLSKKGYEAKVLATGENYSDFHGGADSWSPKSSFFWAVIQVRRPTVQTEAAAGGSIYVNTDVYERNHGAKPKGRGNWAFGIGTSDPDMQSDEPFWANMLYSEAVKAAKEQAKKRGVNVVYVLP
jgi:hypothetical protein